MPKPIQSENNQQEKEIRLNFTCSLVNQRASSISFLSTLISVDTATARQPSIREEGIGHGWQETYWTWPTLTPLSSSTSLRTASSIVSPIKCGKRTSSWWAWLGILRSKWFKPWKITLDRNPIHRIRKQKSKSRLEFKKHYFLNIWLHIEPKCQETFHFLKV